MQNFTVVIQGGPSAIYFSNNSSVRKMFNLTGDGRQGLGFAWDTFNLTDTPKFNAFNLNAEIDIPGTFGQYASSMATLRPAGRQVHAILGQV